MVDEGNDNDNGDENFVDGKNCSAIAIVNGCYGDR